MADETQDAQQNSEANEKTASEDFKAQVTEKEIYNGKLFAVISYLWVLCFVPFLIPEQRYNRFTIFHANQGLILFGFSLISLGIGYLICCIGPFVAAILHLAIIIFAGIGIYKALQGEMWDMPVVSDIVTMFNLNRFSDPEV